MFQKEFNDEITVSDMSVPNPLPDLLEIRYEPSAQVFTAKTSVVLKIVYTDSNSLSAFGSDVMRDCYVVYHRDKENDFYLLLHLQGEGESLSVVDYGALDEDIIRELPARYR